VAFDWDPQGRLFVAEMGDYPRHSSRDGGRIRLLSDADGDGRYDRSTVFLDDLDYPNSVKWWRGGVLVTSAAALVFRKAHDYGVSYRMTCRR
jgi:glucose/arabinose dehydrogenase